MRICLTLGARWHLSNILARERLENPQARFRIWEVTSGRYNDAFIRLGLIIDEATDEDEHASCCGLPFVASRDFLALRGEPHIFCVFIDEKSQLDVYAF